MAQELLPCRRIAIDVSDLIPNAPFGQVATHHPTGGSALVRVQHHTRLLSHGITPGLAVAGTSALA